MAGLDTVNHRSNQRAARGGPDSSPGAVQSGIAVLELSTRHPPDRERGDGVVHLHLELMFPAVVASQLVLADAGQRPGATPRQPTRLLWSPLGFPARYKHSDVVIRGK
jgi:hypothetical protein